MVDLLEGVPVLEPRSVDLTQQEPPWAADRRLTGVVRLRDADR